MNKLAHGLVTASFAAVCGLLWGMFTLIQNTAAQMLETQPLPAFARLCFGFRPLLAWLPVLAAAYCVFVWVRKSSGPQAWVGYFASTVYALILLALPVMITCWLLFIQMIEILAKR